MDELLRVWGENIREAREAHHWTQPELAKRAHVAHATVNRWERGLMEPNRHHKADLCRLLGDGLFPVNGEMQ